MTFKATVTVRRRPTILDPEGKAVEHALQSLELRGVARLRIGKLIELHVDAADADAARATVDEACRKLLANPVMDDYTIALEEAGA
ncbi:MAG: phosphoribosylformylglycinamidine synthase subunit PurS [Ignavibacteria bacterium]|nr:phosphoribosylformylglycinamidine synthase subunit PurS [Ignavibacteria bacterium]